MGWRPMDNLGSATACTYGILRIWLFAVCSLFYLRVICCFEMHATC